MGIDSAANRSSGSGFQARRGGGGGEGTSLLLIGTVMGRGKPVKRLSLSCHGKERAGGREGQDEVGSGGDELRGQWAGLGNGLEAGDEGEGGMNHGWVAPRAPGRVAADAVTWQTDVREEEAGLEQSFHLPRAQGS